MEIRSIWTSGPFNLASLVKCILVLFQFQTYLSGNKLEEMELMCSLAVQNEAVIKRLNAIYEEYILKHGLNEMEKCVDEAIKVFWNQFHLNLSKNETLAIASVVALCRIQRSTCEPFSMCTTSTMVLWLNSLKKRLVSRQPSRRHAHISSTKMRWLERRRVQISVPNFWPPTVTSCWGSPTKAWTIRISIRLWMK